MSQDFLDLLKVIDPGVLAEVAQKSLNLPSLKLGDWTVTPLAHEKVIETTGGLFTFSGHGWNGDKKEAWTVILKIIQHPEFGCEGPQDLCFWQREMKAYQSGLLAELPGSVCTPNCFGVSESEPGGWIWLENVKEVPVTVWTLSQFHRAAYHLGKFAGTQLVERPIHNAPWMCRSLFRGFYADDDWWAKFIQPASPNNAWQREVVQTVFPEALQRRVLQIWAEKWQLITANEGLPQVFCHNDAHRRNLMLREDGNGQDEMVAFDWGFCGFGGLGNDLGELIGTSLSYFAIDPAHVEDLEAVALKGYLDGLREVGWTGDEHLPRLGYLLSLALYWGGTLPCEVALAQPGESKVNLEAKYGRSIETLLPGWTRLAEFALERADEARYWIEQVI